MISEKKKEKLRKRFESELNQLMIKYAKKGLIMVVTTNVMQRHWRKVK